MPEYEYTHIFTTRLVTDGSNERLQHDKEFDPNLQRENALAGK